MSDYLLALDGGGSKTDVLCTDLTGQTVAEVTVGPTSLTATGNETAFANFQEALKNTMSELPSDAHFSLVVMGLAGADTPEEVSEAEKQFRTAAAGFPIQDFVLFNDIQFVLESSDEDHAIALIAGTGSQCFGRNAAGQTAKTSGMDYLLSDQGSGYEIGRQTLRAAALSYDGRSPKTQLEKLIMDHYQVSNFPDLKLRVYQPALTKSQIAELAVMCLTACEQGDEAAKIIVLQAVDDLVTMVRTVAQKLELTTAPTEVVCTGSVLRNPFIFDHLKANLSMSQPNLTLITPEHTAVYGGIKIGLKRLVHE